MSFKSCMRSELKGKHFRTQESAGKALGRASKKCSREKSRKRR